MSPEISKVSLNRRRLMQSLALAPLLNAMLPPSQHVAAEAPLKVAMLNWVPGFHPVLADIEADFAATFEVDQSLVSGSFATDIPEVYHGAADLLVGVTPFLELDAALQAGSLQPWDSYVPDGLLEDLPSSIRAECSHDGQLVAWPLFYDLVTIGASASVLEAAGIDPEVVPATWDELLANAEMVQSSGAAEFGWTYDVAPWRSFIPIALSISADVWRPDGMFAWTSDAAVEALERLKRMTERANPDVTFGPNMNAWGETTGYFLTMHNDHIFNARQWAAPGNLRMFPGAAPEGGPGGTVFWNTCAVLIAAGENKPEAAQYVDALIHDERLWEANFSALTVPGSPYPGQLPPLLSVWESITANHPDWLEAAPWAEPVWQYGLEHGQFIKPTPLGLMQFDLAWDHLVGYLNGTEPDAGVVLQNAEQAIDAYTSGTPTAA